MIMGLPRGIGGVANLRTGCARLRTVTVALLLLLPHVASVEGNEEGNKDLGPD